MRAPDPHIAAFAVRVRGVVQGVGFRPFVYRLAYRHGLCGWVLNAEDGVEIHIEGPPEAVQIFLDDLENHPPPAASIARFEAIPAPLQHAAAFTIRESSRGTHPTVRITPDLTVCADCRQEVLNPADRRFGYPYINCTNCGPRYSIITGLPYDRLHTTMHEWPMCDACRAEYHDPLDRRFHAQPTACPTCGPHYVLSILDDPVARGTDAITMATALLRDGQILAIKGVGGYHLACDAQNAGAVRTLRTRKFRKEKPFALMVPDLDTARQFVQMDEQAERLLTSTARPIVLLPRHASAEHLPDAIAPGTHELGLMLPYTPLHVLLFEHGAPRVLVMTSANRSSEPIAYRDDDALERLAELADAFLVGERPIARRIDDSVVRVGAGGPLLQRRARGYAPGAVTRLPTARPILAVGADLKNTITLAVDGEAFVSQHIGDLEHYDVEQAFAQTIGDLAAMYEVRLEDALIVHDAHPQYRSTLRALDLAGEKLAVQHHCAHIASVLAERQAWDQSVVGFAFDGTGYGDDGSVWGGEVFAGNLREGFEHVAHLYPALLPGGDAAARFPVQAAAGFLCHLDTLPDLTASPFHFPHRYRLACDLIHHNLRTFRTTSMGRLFDTVAALLGFTDAITFEGQAAIWLEQQAHRSPPVAAYTFPALDYRPLLQAIIADRERGRPIAGVARAFHASLADTVVEMSTRLARERGTDTVVVSGGVFQNQLLLREIEARLQDTALTLWTNQLVPPNDGGISLGQAAMGAFAS